MVENTIETIDPNWQGLDWKLEKTLPERDANVVPDVQAAGLAMIDRYGTVVTVTAPAGIRRRARAGPARLQAFRTLPMRVARWHAWCAFVAGAFSSTVAKTPPGGA